MDEGDIRARTSEVLPACVINHVLCKCNKHDNKTIEMQVQSAHRESRGVEWRGLR